MKKRICLFLTMIFMLSACTFSVSADDSVLGENITYTTEGTTLYLNGTGAMKLSLEYLTDTPWYHLKDTVDTLVIGEGITSVAEGAFNAFRALKNITFPTTLQTIESSAFLSCEGLTSVTLPNHTAQIETGAFAGCEALSQIIVPGSVFYISSDAFYNCYNLTVVGIAGSYAEEYAKQQRLPFDASFSPSNEILVRLNKTYLEFDQPPVILNDRTLVPLRKIFESLGAEVLWDGETRTVTAEKDGTKVSLTIDSNILTKNGTSVEIDVPATIVNDRTMVPARAVAEAFGCSVNWDGITKTVLIYD